MTSSDDVERFTRRTLRVLHGLPSARRAAIVEKIDLFIHAFDEDLRGAVASHDRALGL